MFLTAHYSTPAPFIACRTLKVRTSGGKVYKPKSKEARQLKLQAKYKSHCHKGTLDPVFVQDFSLAFSDFSECLVLKLYDRDIFSRDDFLGKVRIPLASLQKNAYNHEWWDLKDNALGELTRGRVNVKLFATKMPDAAVIAAGPNSSKLCRHPSFILDQQKSFLRYTSELESVSSVKDISVLTATWNVGNAPPDVKELHFWLPHQQRGGTDTTAAACDLVVVGVQECSYEAQSSKSCKSEWLQCLERHFGPNYQCMAYHSLWEIRIVVFCKRELYRFVRDVRTEDKAIGIGNVLGNKGGVTVSFTLFDTSFCFLNTHLAAHQDKVRERNEGLARILRSIGRSDRFGMDLVHAHDHVFIMGDMNYRLDFGSQGTKRTPSKSDFGALVQLIEMKEFSTLFEEYDQLRAMLKSHAVLNMFREGRYDFPPTFKCMRGLSEAKYDSKRSPAWCDRILWKSLRSKHSARLTTLFASPDVTTSDHKPVSAVLSCPVWSSASCHDPRRGRCTIKVVNLQGHLDRPSSAAFDDEATSKEERESAVRARAHAADRGSAEDCRTSDSEDEEDAEEQVESTQGDAVSKNRPNNAAGHVGKDGRFGGTLLSSSSKADEESKIDTEVDQHLEKVYTKTLIEMQQSTLEAHRRGGIQRGPDGAISSDRRDPKLHPSVLFQCPAFNGPVSTSVRQNTLHPVWVNQDDVPDINCRFNNLLRLSQSTISVKLFHGQSARSRVCLGVGTISLQPLASVRDPYKDYDLPCDVGTPSLTWQSVAFPFRCPLSSGGSSVGTLEGTLQFYWENVEETTSKTTRAGRKHITHENEESLTVISCSYLSTAQHDLISEHDEKEKSRSLGSSDIGKESLGIAASDTSTTMSANDDGDGVGEEDSMRRRMLRRTVSMADVVETVLTISTLSSSSSRVQNNNIVSHRTLRPSRAHHRRRNSDPNSSLLRRPTPGGEQRVSTSGNMPSTPVEKVSAPPEYDDYQPVPADIGYGDALSDSDTSPVSPLFIQR